MSSITSGCLSGKSYKLLNLAEILANYFSTWDILVKMDKSCSLQMLS